MLGLISLGDVDVAGTVPQVDLSTISPLQAKRLAVPSATALELNIQAVRQALFTRQPTLRNLWNYVLRRLPSWLQSRSLSLGPLSFNVEYFPSTKILSLDAGLSYRTTVSGRDLIGGISSMLSTLFDGLQQNGIVGRLADTSSAETAALVLADTINLQVTLGAVVAVHVELNLASLSVSVDLTAFAVELKLAVSGITERLSFGPSFALELQNASASVHMRAAGSSLSNLTLTGSFEASLPLDFQAGALDSVLDRFLDGGLIEVVIQDDEIFDATLPTITFPKIELPDCSQTASIAFEFLDQLASFADNLAAGFSETLAAYSGRRISLLGVNTTLSLPSSVNTTLQNLVAQFKAKVDDALNNNTPLPLGDLTTGDLAAAAFCLVPDLSGDQDLVFVWNRTEVLNLGDGSLASLVGLPGSLLSSPAGDAFSLEVEANVVFRAHLHLNTTQSLMAMSAGMTVQGRASLAATASLGDSLVAATLAGELVLQNVGLEVSFPGRGQLIDTDSFARQLTRTRLASPTGQFEMALCVNLDSDSIPALNLLPAPTLLVTDENIFDDTPPQVTFDGDISDQQPTILALLDQLTRMDFQFAAVAPSLNVPGISLNGLMPAIGGTLFGPLHAAAQDYFASTEPRVDGALCTTANQNFPRLTGLVSALLDALRQLDLGPLRLSGGLNPETKLFTLDMTFDWAYEGTLADLINAAANFRGVFDLLRQGSAVQPNASDTGNSTSGELPDSFGLDASDVHLSADIFLHASLVVSTAARPAATPAANGTNTTTADCNSYIELHDDTNFAAKVGSRATKKKKKKKKKEGRKEEEDVEGDKAKDFAEKKRPRGRDASRVRRAEVMI